MGRRNKLSSLPSRRTEHVALEVNLLVKGKCSENETYFHFLDKLYVYETYFYQLWPASDRDFTGMVRSSRKIPLKIAA